MNLFDRYGNITVSEQELPNQIDFGRFCIIGDDGNIRDITYSNFQTKKAIRQELLLDKNKSIQDILIDIAIDIKKAGNDNFTVIPLIRRIRNKLGLNDFEKLLYEKVFHLEEIFRVPHYLLEREIEKVHVSRAKRIPSKSYQYLASHTEDWVHKSIVSFKPSRILNEELESNLDIYENQLTIAFLERCLIYINSRMKEIQDIKLFLADYEKLLKNRNDQKGWYKKINRNLSLIGAVYEDDHFHGKNKDGSTLTETEEALNQINKRLLLLRKSNLFDLINKRATQSITLRNTNVLVNHKHYRYIKTLWIELDKVKPEKSESEKIKFEQDVIKGLRAFTKGLICYTLKTNLDFEPKGNYTNFEAEHLQLSKVTFQESDKGSLILRIGEKQINLVIVGNLPEFDEKLISLLKDRQTFILYYDDKTTIYNSRLIPINPLDPDSVERVGVLIRKFLLSGYLDIIQKEFKFKQLLKEYIKYIPEKYLEFKITTYTYKFHSYPKAKLSFEEIKASIENDSLYKSKSRPDKENIISCIQELLSEIENNSLKLRNDYLNCFNCGEKLQSFNIDRLNYLKCPSCSCLIDSSNSEKATLKIDDFKFSNLTDLEFGMDSLTLNFVDL
ncbi:DUF2357 domain-containing protein [Aquiflexum gelatinilyticum]|uniref:DUF2357 domain-containing protein n=1 Tax=Aquiflexum gelatinilyticum TaxID=2961943 RepID=UPI00216A32E9|nr:DUF2357 domain-containing protein [Aquiflexum gelatinilyticum]MCS4432851.1 DUF2357 domain-containing protein [Aquiflexum gelatinilyticum]